MKAASRIFQVSLKTIVISLIVTVGFLQGCSDPADPSSEQIESLDLTGPSTIVADESFSLVIQAVGSNGTRPMATVNGNVSLAVSTGTISPDTATMVDGEATVDVTLSGVDGIVRITALFAQATGDRELTVASLRALPGNPSANAAGSIPDLDYFAHDEDFNDDHPDLPDLPVSINTILLNFTLEATVGGANDLISRIGGIIVGGIPGTPSGKGGMLMLRVPTATHAEMDALINSLGAESVIQFVERDVVLAPMFVPDSGDPHPEWIWERDPTDGNWGMEMCRMPQMWNLNSALEKRGDSSIITGIVDAGYFDHSDLAFQRVRGSGPHYHGTFVAGILGAGFNNEKGIDGVSPFVQLRVSGPLGQPTLGDIAEGIEAVTRAGARVINISMARSWRKVHPDNSSSGRTRLSIHARLMMWTLDSLRDSGTMPLIIVASGNDSASHPTPVEARWASPLTHAALELGEPDILVVEAIEVENGGRRLPMSNPGGHVSAPGGMVLSLTQGDGFLAASGTSAAAPHVAGLASYLLSIDPSLTNTELVGLILENTQPASPNLNAEVSPRIDAFASALAIDGLRGNDAVVRMLVDIDDGTIDGNQRVLTEDPVIDFHLEDIDGDGGLGDGVIDMSDFRRWRDWYHQTAMTPGAIFDGSGDHPKFDVNGNGFVELPAQEDVFPRADFNGDGTLDIAATSVVPGDHLLPQSDFEVLARYFDDSAFPEETLEQLIFSGDIFVDLSQYVDSGRFDQVVSQAATIAGEIIEFHDHTPGVPAYVFTLESDETYEVTTWGISNGDTLCSNTETFELGLCEDKYWSPLCSGVIVEITLAQFIEPGSASPLLIRAGLVDALGSVDYQDGIQLDISSSGGTVAVSSGVTAIDGFFDTEVTMGAGSQQLNVFVTATDPVTGESTVALATAHPLQSNSGVRPICESVSLSAHARALVGSIDCDQSQNFHSDEECNFVPVSESFGFACSAAGPDCGVSISTSANSAIDFQPEFHPVTGDLVAIIASGSVSASFSGNLEGNCGQVGNTARAIGGFSIQFEVMGDAVPVRLTGSVEMGSSGISRPGFHIRTQGPFAIISPENGLDFDETWDYEPGEYRVSVGLQASPHFQAGASAGSFTLELRFGP